MKPGRKGNEIATDGLCKIGRAWTQNAKKCTLCPVLVPEHLGFRLNPEVLTAIFERTAKIPTVRLHQSDNYLFLLESSAKGEAPFVCDLCAQSMAEAINYRDKNTVGKLLVADDRVPLFVGPAEVRRQEALPGVREFAEGFARGDSYIFSRGSPETGTDCALFKNRQELCRCGGRDDWNRMRYQLRETTNGRVNAAPYGKACAKLVERAGFQLFDNYSEFVISQKQQRLEKQGSD
ncbi:hypothetical protein COY25_00260 [Candidatus Uhrbacteria bacterium CG_4_10_14_0_2_um_filter_41_7]|nr:MAG: hypothetical protein COY25_00260 [Candidatus Uhrbacteria bacterium CG_4_10_14_0_2_um_filter_41_7]